MLKSDAQSAVGEAWNEMSSRGNCFGSHPFNKAFAMCSASSILTQSLPSPHYLARLNVLAPSCISAQLPNGPSPPYLLRA